MPSLTMGYRPRDRQRADLLRDGRLALKLANGLHSFAYIQEKVGGSRARLYRAMKAAREADLLPGSGISAVNPLPGSGVLPNASPWPSNAVFIDPLLE